ncbi:MAG TPA: hypothetical protein VGL02_05900 [Streptomyces sp.]
MATTTSYGTWVNHGAGEIDLETNVTVSLGDYVGDYGVGGLAWAYREAINDALDGSGIRLAGSEFYGPVPAVVGDPGAVIEQAVESVDFWALAERFDRA